MPEILFYALLISNRFGNHHFSKLIYSNELVWKQWKERQCRVSSDMQTEIRHRQTQAQFSCNMNVDIMRQKIGRNPLCKLSETFVTRPKINVYPPNLKMQSLLMRVPLHVDESCFRTGKLRQNDVDGTSSMSSDFRGPFETCLTSTMRWTVQEDHNYCWFLAIFNVTVVLIALLAFSQTCPVPETVRCYH